MLLGVNPWQNTSGEHEYEYSDNKIKAQNPRGERYLSYRNVSARSSNRKCRDLSRKIKGPWSCCQGAQREIMILRDNAMRMMLNAKKLMRWERTDLRGAARVSAWPTVRSKQNNGSCRYRSALDWDAKWSRNHIVKRAAAAE
jgi:hypothetical protein